MQYYLYRSVYNYTGILYMEQPSEKKDNEDMQCFPKNEVKQV